MSEKVLVPDVGEAEDVEVVELLVAVGDTIAADDSLLVLESDKASMEVPSPIGGTVVSIAVSEGDKVEEGTLLLEIDSVETGSASDEPVAEAAPAEEVTARSTSEDVPAEPTGTPKKIETSKVISVPDVGDAEEVTVVELLVRQGDSVTDGDSLVVLESDKASMEIPTDLTGVVQEVMVHEGDEVKEGDPLVTIVGTVDASDSVPADEDDGGDDTAGVTKPAPQPAKPLAETPMEAEQTTTSSAKVYAGPAVRKQAREYGVDLSTVSGTGRKDRILKEDIQLYVKQRLSSSSSAQPQGSGIPEIPVQDFTKFGEIEEKTLSRIRKVSAKNLHRSWLNIPHVTQFDEADITDLETFRSSQNQILQKDGVKLTPLAFLVKAVVDALIRYPQFNSSISKDYDHLVLKKYYHIGIAVETDDGLVVPVLKDADKKGIVQIAQETAALAAQARDKKLPMDAMQGASFTISSLGGIGGTKFTPIVNAPEVAILGVSRSKVTPVWDGSDFQPRTILPLSLSYDHRAIDGAEAARFTNYLAKVLSDMRHVLL